jgi:hypothetical protein
MKNREPKMISTNLSQDRKAQFIRHSAFENLYVIPHIKGRLVFAELAARAIETGRFDRLVVDMPYFMNGGSWLDTPIGLFPYVSSIVIRKADLSFVSFPFVPNDAVCAAVAAAKIMEGTGTPIEINCIDDSNVINYPDGCRHQHISGVLDDYFVFTDGLEDYFAHLFAKLDVLWERLSEEQRFFLEYRAGIMSERLRRILRKGKNTLFVCDYQVWRLMSKIIGKEPAQSDRHFFPQWKRLDAALVIGDPYLFWARGLLDDYPAAVAKFHESLQLGTLHSFNKLVVIDDTIKSLRETAASKEFGTPSIRKIVSFDHYLRNMLAAKRRLTPFLISQLHDAACSCIGKGFAKAMATHLLNYPYPDTQKVLDYLILERDAIIGGGNTFDVPDLSELIFCHTGTKEYCSDEVIDIYASNEERFEFINKIHSRITKKETDKFGYDSGLMWAIEKDYKLHETACANVRSIVEKISHLEISKRSFGPMGDGIHWKSTIASRVTGENAIHIKLRKTSRGNKSISFDEFTPIVFLFADDISQDMSETIADFNITQRNMALGNNNFPFEKSPPPDYVYSVYYTFSKWERTCEGHIIKRRVTSIAFLYTLRVMGFHRYGSIVERPSAYQCRTGPMSDPEMEGFPLCEKGMAWAVKYAASDVLVAAKNGWKASRRLNAFAESKRVRIVPVSLTGFAKDFIERLRTISFTSTALKKHPDRDNILKRFM